jgi:hypothetical protein
MLLPPVLRGPQTSGGGAQSQPAGRVASALAASTNSDGIITMVIVFCSAPTSVNICMRRNSSEAGVRMISSAASRSFHLGFRLDDARTLLAQRFGFLCHGPLHRGWNFDVLHLDVQDLHAPGFRHLIDARLQQGRKLLALLQHIVERVLADDVAQSRERHLDDRVRDVLHFDDREIGFDDAVPDDGIDLDRDIVARHCLLLLDTVGQHTHVDLGCAVDAKRKDPEEPRAAGADIASEAEDERALKLLRHAKSGDHRDGKKDENAEQNRHERLQGPNLPPLYGVTRAVVPKERDVLFMPLTALNNWLL